MNGRRRMALWGGWVRPCWGMLPSGGEVNQAALAGTAWWMLWWWIGGAPIGATSLLPLALFPLFGVMDIASVAAPFGSNSFGCSSGDPCLPWLWSATAYTGVSPFTCSAGWGAVRGEPRWGSCWRRPC